MNTANGLQQRWSTSSVVLHWGVAALIIGLAVGGFVMTDLAPGSGGRLWLSRLHKVGGVAVLLLTVARLVARRRGPAVEPLPVPELHGRGIGAIHALLIAGTFAIGVTGFVTAARSTWPDYLLGKLPEAPALEHLASRQLHEVLVFGLLALVVLHVGGVLVHQLRHGGALRRMVPFLD